MKLVEIKPNEFNELALSEPNISFYQTINWGEFYNKLGYKPLYIGYSDEHNIYYALALIFVKNKESFFSRKKALCPYGYLINYYDTELFKNFTVDLKKFLSKKGVGQITINPNVTYLTSRGNNELLIKNIQSIGYKKTRNSSLFVTKIDNIPDIEIDEDVYLETYVVENSDQQAKLFKANPNYKKLYDAMGKYAKFVVCELDIDRSINELNIKLNNAKTYIELHKEEINNDVLDSNKELVANKQPLLDLLTKYTHDYADNNLLAVTCFIEFNNKATILFTDSKKDYSILKAVDLLNCKTLETLNELGYESFESFIETETSKKIDLIGEFTYQVK